MIVWLQALAQSDRSVWVEGGVVANPTSEVEGLSPSN